ncbi:hypothetical protein PCANC_22362 [Puccinia coronata f. sp. avenae]|uniref:Integrase catalytic domain-containing protein n=1 Tax=Puccinia coronata f. sp. avenae TaxID=200324 RepID=A0A2N5U235_9BASI|nr:hypothetical protein PCANC_22362 [Puccinia coronata f. sp. avenae]
MQKKSESEAKIISFIKEIGSHLHITLAVLHTDRGAERFNQAILVKICCMMAQFSVPLNYWDEAARFASSLINM